ncbi:hypothetical protein UlMin_024905 [Ulmus minor]
MDNGKPKASSINTLFFRKNKIESLESLKNEENPATEDTSEKEICWNHIFVLACVVAVSLDPLFIYLPMINQKEMCVEIDNKLKTTVLVLRSFTDIIYLVDIIYSVFETYEKLNKKESGWIWNQNDLSKNVLKVTQRLPWFVIIVDFLAVLPIPQVVMLVFFPRLRGPRFLDTRKYLNLILLSQYVPRVLRIYLSCKEFTNTLQELTLTVWVRGTFNFFLYVLASHIFGAFWYFFALQRETACWHQACRSHSKCVPSTYDCGENTPRNVTLLHLSCPINPPDVELFDFGIFLVALQSGVLGFDDFPRKFVHCFWWGLQNLSSLGQNLQTSTYIWENTFAISISIIGLLLFLYLIGNLQTYMQLGTQRSEEIRRKMKLKKLDVELWIKRNNLPKHLKTLILQNVKSKLQENKDVHVENLLSFLPSDVKKDVKRSLCLHMINKMPMLENIDQKVQDHIIEHLKPVIYDENKYIIREGEPVGMMLFITQGAVWTFKDPNQGNGGINDAIETNLLEKGQFFGEQLLNWATTLFNNFGEIPMSQISVKSHTKVEALAIMAKDLKSVVDHHWWAFRSQSTNFDFQRLAVTKIEDAWHRKQNKKNKKRKVCKFGV